MMAAGVVGVVASGVVASDCVYAVATHDEALKGRHDERVWAQSAAQADEERGCDDERGCAAAGLTVVPSLVRWNHSLGAAAENHGVSGVRVVGDKHTTIIHVEKCQDEEEEPPVCSGRTASAAHTQQLMPQQMLQNTRHVHQHTNLLLPDGQQQHRVPLQVIPPHAHAHVTPPWMAWSQHEHAQFLDEIEQDFVMRHLTTNQQQQQQQQQLQQQQVVMMANKNNIVPTTTSEVSSELYTDDTINTEELELDDTAHSQISAHCTQRTNHNKFPDFSNVKNCSLRNVSTQDRCSAWMTKAF